MLLVYKNRNSTIVVTLTEKATITTPVYLFSFTNDITKEETNFIAPDISAHTERYNEFIITETSGTTNYSSGTIELLPTGTWTYRIFEQTSSSNLDPRLCDNLTPLEIGIVKVIGTTESPTAYNGQDDTIIAYGTGTE